MLSLEAATRLISLISNQNEPVSTIHSKFSSEFSFSEKVSSLVNLSFLLSEAVLSHPQQINACWIMYSEFEEYPIDVNPYFSTFTYINKVYLSNPNSFCPSLCDMIHIILNNEKLNFLNQLTVPQIMDYNFDKYNYPNQKVKQKNQNCLETEYIPRIVIEKDENLDSHLTNDDVLIQLIVNGVFLSPFDIIFPRSPPQVTGIMKEELQIITGTENPPFLLDQNIVSNSKEAAVILLNKSTEETLNLSEKDSLIQNIEKYPSIVETSAFPYSKLNFMINNNKEIAKKYFSLAIEQRKDLLNFLTNLDITINSVEVIKYLINQHRVDDEFIQNYITQSMISIQKIQDHDTQEIKVMFFCRFVLFILNENLIKLNQDVLFELRAFCYDFSKRRIPDAQKLYQDLTK